MKIDSWHLTHSGIGQHVEQQRPMLPGRREQERGRDGRWGWTRAVNNTFSPTPRAETHASDAKRKIILRRLGSVRPVAESQSEDQHTWPGAARMGAMMARDAPPVLQTLVSALLRTKLEVAFAGLDGSGKTTLTRLLQGQASGTASAAAGPPAAIIPTIGLVVQAIRHRGIDFAVWDLGGHRRFRSDWSMHVRGCGALIFVIDSTDGGRLPEARQALQQLFEHAAVRALPLLVLVNKTDLLSPAERAHEEVHTSPLLPMLL